MNLVLLKLNCHSQQGSGSASVAGILFDWACLLWAMMPQYYHFSPLKVPWHLCLWWSLGLHMPWAWQWHTAFVYSFLIGCDKWNMPPKANVSISTDMNAGTELMQSYLLRKWSSGYSRSAHSVLRYQDKCKVKKKLETNLKTSKVYPWAPPRACRSQFQWPCPQSVLVQMMIY